MQHETVSWIVFVLLALGGSTTILRMTLGVLVICRARRRDLAKVVDAIGTWFWKCTRIIGWQGVETFELERPRLLLRVKAC
jgi:hypothetical protein